MQFWSTSLKCMNKIAISFVAIAVILSLSVGATGAYFTSQVTATGNTFASGTIELTVNNKSSGVSRVYMVSGLHPGSWDLAGQAILKNIGTLNGHAWVEIKDVDVSGGDRHSLGDLVWASFQLNQSPWTRFGTFISLNKAQGVKTDLLNINAGQSLPIVVYAVWPTTNPDWIDNQAQGQTLTFDVVFHLDQIH